MTCHGHSVLNTISRLRQEFRVGFEHRFTFRPFRFTPWTAKQVAFSKLSHDPSSNTLGFIPSCPNPGDPSTPRPHFPRPGRVHHRGSFFALGGPRELDYASTACLYFSFERFWHPPRHRTHLFAPNPLSNVNRLIRFVPPFFLSIFLYTSIVSFVPPIPVRLRIDALLHPDCAGR